MFIGFFEGYLLASSRVFLVSLGFGERVGLLERDFRLVRLGFRAKVCLEFRVKG